MANKLESIGPAGTYLPAGEMESSFYFGVSNPYLTGGSVGVRSPKLVVMSGPAEVPASSIEHGGTGRSHRASVGAVLAHCLRFSPPNTETLRLADEALVRMRDYEPVAPKQWSEQIASDLAKYQD